MAENNPKAAQSKDTLDHVLKYTSLFGGVQVLKILVSIVRNKLASRFLGAWGFGLNASFVKVGEFINAITNFGIPFSSVRNLSQLYEASDQEEMRRFVGVIRTWSFWTAVLSALLCLLSIPVCILIAPIVDDMSHMSVTGFRGIAISTLTDILYDLCDAVTHHRKEIVLISLYVASLPIEASECAILKGMRKLKTIAKVELVASLLSFAICIPLFYALAHYGVAISLLACGWMVAGLHLLYSCRLFPYRIHPLSRRVMRAGWPLVRIGFPYMLASIIGTMSLLIVYRFLDNMHAIGLYNAAYGIVVTYAGMVFVSVESDYFPRLSAANNDRQRMNRIINQQMVVCLLLITPLLIMLVLMMARVFRLLYTDEFVAAFPMSICAVYFMFCKALITPMGYIPLAKGDSMTYLFMETAYAVYFVILMYFCYDQWQLIGAGIALSCSALLEVLILGLYYSMHYGFRLERRTILLGLCELVCLSASIPLSFHGTNPWAKYSIGLTCLLTSGWIAWRILSRESDIISKIKARFQR